MQFIDTPPLSPGKSLALIPPAPSAANNPKAEADDIVARFNQGVEAVVDACQSINRSIARFRDRQDNLDAFIEGLASGHVISRSEARMGLGSPKLSKLQSIGEHAEILQQPGVLEKLEPGYTILYQTVLLYRAMEGGADAKIRLLVEVLGRCDGKLSRDFLSQALKDRKRAARSRKSSAGADQAPDVEPARKIPELIASGQFSDLILATPSQADIRKLARDYVSSDTLARCLRVHEAVADNATAVVIGRVRDLSTIETKLLPLCGFNRLSRVLLITAPETCDVTEHRVAVIAHRGSNGRSTDPEIDWTTRALIDPGALAARVAPHASAKLHIFANTTATGWTTVVGDDNWSEMPSI